MKPIPKPPNERRFILIKVPFRIEKKRNDLKGKRKHPENLENTGNLKKWSGFKNRFQPKKNSGI